MLKTRVITGVIAAPLFLALVYLEFPYFHVLVAAITAVMAWEFARMDGNVGRKRHALVTASAVIAIGIMAGGQGAIAILTVVVAVLALIVADQMAGRRGIHMVQIAPAYAAFPGMALLYLMGTGGHLSVFWLLTVVWATDIGAYASGRLIGGPKLAPAISPNKTWSGAAGGVVCAVLASMTLLWASDLSISVFLGLLALFTSILSQLGDLFESALKRRYQVKDSGNLIPGHGGVMDRFDGLWAAAPLAALFCVIFGGGVQQW